MRKYIFANPTPFGFFALSPNGGRVVEGLISYSPDPKEWSGNISGVSVGWKVQAIMTVKLNVSDGGNYDGHFVSTGLIAVP